MDVFLFYSPEVIPFVYLSRVLYIFPSRLGFVGRFFGCLIKQNIKQFLIYYFFVLDMCSLNMMLSCTVITIFPDYSSASDGRES